MTQLLGPLAHAGKKVSSCWHKQVSAHGRKNPDGILSRLLLSLRLLALNCLSICVMSWVCCRPRFRIFIPCGGLTYLRQPWGVRNARTEPNTSVYIVDPQLFRGGKNHETFTQHSLSDA